MRVMVLGANGMLGQSLCGCLHRKNIETISVARNHADYCFDLTDDSQLKELILHLRPDVVINAAAKVDISFCEANPGEAYRINGRLPGIVAGQCARYGGYFVQISTDHFFRGDGIVKHDESTPVCIVNEYARTKYIGEQMSLLYEKTLVVRTNIVGFRGTDRPTFLEWAIGALVHGHKINLFSDYYTSSMNTTDFSGILVDIIQKRPSGLYHIASSEVASKRDFVVGLSKVLYGREPDYDEGSVSKLAGTLRADSLGLDCGKAERLLGYKMPGLQDTLLSIKRDYLKRSSQNAVQQFSDD